VDKTDFDSEEDYKTYAAHPEHQAIIVDRVKPILESRAAVQFSLANAQYATERAV